MRTGPHPLSAHLSYAAQLCARDGARYNMEDMLAGVKKYQSYGELPQLPPLEEMLRAGSMRLLGMTHEGQGDAPLLLIPSLINRYSIFDLHEEQSFVRWLYARGHDVYVIDWGDLKQGEELFDMDALIEERLLHCADYLVSLYGCAPHGLGYCMGGTMLGAAACADPAAFQSLIFLAAPWDFDCEGDDLVREMRLWAPSALAQLTGRNFLPCSSIQTLFAGLHPEQGLHKFSRFLHMYDGSLEEQLFVAVEDWLNDGVDLPHDVAMCCIREWYGENKIVRGDWDVLGTRVRAESLQHASLVVASTSDRLVSHGSAKALSGALPNCDVIDPACGHIGMMAGRATIEKVWEPINAWITQQNHLRLE